MKALRLLRAAVVAAALALPHAAAAQSQPHVYLLRGLFNIFSLGIDEMTYDLRKLGIEASAHNHLEADLLVAYITREYRAGRHGPVVLVGHSMGAESVMVMAIKLDRNNVPVDLLIPIDALNSFAVPKNVRHCFNVTQRKYAYMRPGPGFRGRLQNFDVTDPSINHLSIDKSRRVHRAVLAVIQEMARTSRP
jgi:thioesterase domain-containing protein